ncbi:hypothetical protein F4780DRAFT_769580 [Xylariomycetidae sp. FL0641]|nr:hypothetical protein F4780DRAFT_769580 [Xylariomycetidae sp. FL0641]
MNYTRKPLLSHCYRNRHRKRRCDGKRPCSTCKDSNADCVYKELPFERIEDASPTAVIDRLSRIESLLEQQSHQINQLNPRGSPSSATPNQSDFPSELLQQLEYPQSALTGHSLIPKNHTAVTTALLALPPVRDAFGDFPRDFFFQLEEKLALPGLLSSLHSGPVIWPPLDRSALDRLAEAYFQHAHPHHPLFTPQDLGVWQAKLLETQDVDDVTAATCFCAYALGTLCSSQSNTKAPETLGLEYFQLAFKIIRRELLWGFRPNIDLCQALLLAASYFSHLGRPLHSWRMAHFASRTFLSIVESRARLLANAEFKDEEVRIFWQCFMFECDRVAEFDVARSGIEPLVDVMPLPQRTEANDNENHIYFMAENAIRRLMNRIASNLYSPDSAQYPAFSTDLQMGVGRVHLQSLLTMSSALNRQLEEWYSSIPEYLRPPKGTDSLLNDRARILRTRYYGARQMLHRPFLQLVAVGRQEYHSPPQSPPLGPDPYVPPVVVERCQTCIDSCVNYLYNAVKVIDKRTPYLWGFSQCCMASFVMLWMAENSPALRSYVPAVRPLQHMVLDKLHKWDVTESSFDAMIRIVEGFNFPDRMDT